MRAARLSKGAPSSATTTRAARKPYLSAPRPRVPTEDNLPTEQEVNELFLRPEYSIDYQQMFPAPLVNADCSHVSAIVATYNEQTFLEESLASAAYTLGEVVVVNHGSDDQSAEIIERVRQYFPNVITAYLPRANTTLGTAKNLAMQLSTKEWAMRWDGDFIAYNRDIMSSLCRVLPNSLTTISESSHRFPYSGYRYRIPRVDGDLFHVEPSSRGGSGPELYLFRRGTVEFRATERFQDQPVMINPLVHRVASNILDSLPGSNNGAFMLHLGSLKTAEKVYSRRGLSLYQLYVHDTLLKHQQAQQEQRRALELWLAHADPLHDPTEQQTELSPRAQRPSQSDDTVDSQALVINATAPYVMTYFEWFFLRNNRRAHRGPEEIQQFRNSRLHRFCVEQHALVPFDLDRWPHTAFVLALLRKKLPLFTVTEVQLTPASQAVPRVRVTDAAGGVIPAETAFRVNLPGCHSISAETEEQD